MMFVIRKASYLASAEELNSENYKTKNINKTAFKGKPLRFKETYAELNKNVADSNQKEDCILNGNPNFGII